jgi:DNA-binding NarL/FixJ family response regulator
MLGHHSTLENKMKRIRVLIADDHAIVRKGIQMIVNTEPTMQLVGEAEDGRDAVTQTQHLQPDVVLMDLVMPDGDGISAIAAIKREHPHIKIIVLTTFEDNYRTLASLKAGADGYLLKDADGEALLQAIQAVQRGEMPLHPRIAHHLLADRVEPTASAKAEQLSQREQEVLQLIAKGFTNKEVADALDLTSGTVKVHVSHILGKLNVSSRTEAAMLAVKLGLAPPDGASASSLSHLA